MYKLIAILSALILSSSSSIAYMTSRNEVTQNNQLIDLSNFSFNHSTTINIASQEWTVIADKIKRDFIIQNKLHILSNQILITNITCNNTYFNAERLDKIPDKSILRFNIISNHNHAIINETKELAIILQNKNNPNPQPDNPDNYELKTIPIAFNQISIRLSENSDFYQVLLTNIINKINVLNQIDKWDHHQFNLEIDGKPITAPGFYKINCEYSNSSITKDYYIPKTKLQVDYTIDRSTKTSLDDVLSWINPNQINPNEPITVSSCNNDIINLINKKLMLHNNANLNQLGGRYGTLFFGVAIKDGVYSDHKIDYYIKNSPGLLESGESHFHFLPSVNGPSIIKNVDLVWYDNSGEITYRQVDFKLQISKINLTINDQDKNTITGQPFSINHDETRGIGEIKKRIMDVINNSSNLLLDKDDALADSNIDFVSTNINWNNPNSIQNSGKIRFTIKGMTHYENKDLSLDMNYTFSKQEINYKTNDFSIKIPKRAINGWNSDIFNQWAKIYKNALTQLAINIPDDLENWKILASVAINISIYSYYPKSKDLSLTYVGMESYRKSIEKLIINKSIFGSFAFIQFDDQWYKSSNFAVGAYINNHSIESWAWCNNSYDPSNFSYISIPSYIQFEFNAVRYT